MFWAHDRVTDTRDRGISKTDIVTVLLELFNSLMI